MWTQNHSHAHTRKSCVSIWVRSIKVEKNAVHMLADGEIHENTVHEHNGTYMLSGMGLL